MVVAAGAPGGECIIEPETVFGGDGICDIREGRRAFIRRHNKIGVIVVMSDHPGWWDDGVAFEIIGNIKQSAHECLVACNGLGQTSLTVAIRHLFDDKPSLGTDRYDNCVLDHLRLDQSQHFRPKVLGPV